MIASPAPRADVHPYPSKLIRVKKTIMVDMLEKGLDLMGAVDLLDPVKDGVGGVH